MRRNGDNAPVGHTCNTIDSVISHMDEVKSVAEDIMCYEDVIDISEAENIKSLADSVIYIMEKIRSDNSELRDWGNECYNRAEEIEKERDSLVDKVEELEEQIRGMHDYIVDLEEEISNLENSLNE